MYPCSNPELVAAASQAGGLGVLQPISLTFVHGYAFRTGIRKIRSLTDRPIGMNALIEQSSKIYRRRMEEWIDVSLEEGVRFFVTSLGKPDWVVQRVEPVGGRVYHDVTERKWAQKGRRLWSPWPHRRKQPRRWTSRTSRCPGSPRRSRRPRVARGVRGWRRERGRLHRRPENGIRRSPDGHALHRDGRMLRQCRI